MAKVQYYAAATLDGFIARPDGNLDWLMGYGADADEDGPMSGRRLWTSSTRTSALWRWARQRIEWVLEHAKEWPYELPTWVFTSRELPQPEGGEVTFTDEAPATVRDAAMEAAGGKNVWMVGGGNLACELGRGGADRRGHRHGRARSSSARACRSSPARLQGELRHVNTKTHANGMVELTYRMPQ